MNADEMKDGGKMVFSIILVLGLVALIFGAYFVVTKFANKQTSALSDTMDSMSNTVLAAYDNETLDGSKVSSLVKQYADSSYAMVVSDITGAGSAGHPEAAIPTGSGIDVNTKYDTSALTGAKFYNVGRVTYPMGSAAGTAGKLILSEANNNVYASSAASTTTTNKVAADNIATDVNPDTTAFFNRMYPGGTTPSNFYIQNSAKYYARTIHDPASDEVIGLVFIAMP